MKLRPHALAAVPLLAAAFAVAAACTSGNDTTPESDAGNDATIEAAAVNTGAGSADAGPEVEASCAVDAGTFDDAEVELGRMLVEQKLCTSCHGETLAGNQNGVPSTTATGGFAYPPNLTPDPATGLACWTNAQIANAILDGIDDHGMKLCAPMPVFGSLATGGLDAGEAEDVIAYLRSLAPVSMVIPATPACPIPEAGPPEEAGSDAGSDGGDASAPDAASDASDAASDAPDGD